MSYPKVNRHLLVHLLQTMRPAYSLAEQRFCETYLEPVFGKPDTHGNYILSVGVDPTIAFTAHTDTVHRQEGIQTLSVADNFITTMTGSCLGADCTTGLWLMLGMIEAGIEGVYIAHAAEEIGGIGSSNLVLDNPSWLANIQACISFDRFGTNSVITHQGGRRTASDAFAVSLADILGMAQLKPDTGGTYTDSMEYSGVVPECTNLSVGYYDQHTSKESQDILFAETLLERLCKADWRALVISRDPTQPMEYDDTVWTALSTASDEVDEESVDAITALLLDRPRIVAELLYDYGLTIDVLADELNLDYSDLQYYTDEHSSKSYY